jgi:hypothetical protein
VIVKKRIAKVGWYQQMYLLGNSKEKDSQSGMRPTDVLTWVHLLVSSDFGYPFLYYHQVSTSVGIIPLWLSFSLLSPSKYICWYHPTVIVKKRIAKVGWYQQMYLLGDSKEKDSQSGMIPTDVLKVGWYQQMYLLGDSKEKDSQSGMIPTDVLTWW